MNKVLPVLATVVLIFAPKAVVVAQTTDNHTATATISTINEIAITGGNPTLTINSATAGSGLDDATDNTSADLDWSTNDTSKKITAATNLASPNFTLKVAAENVTGGTAASQVTLTTVAADFVTSIANTAGGCDLSYTASATVTDGTGSDIHTITYTLTDS